jgi:hypothetical protein
MEYTLEQKRFINKYVEKIINGDAAIFAGAGLSTSAGCVNWKELLRDLAEEIELDVEKESDLVSVAQYHYNKFNRARINDKIINEFSDLERGSENHDILSRIGITSFWTTNYDQLIEERLKSNGKSVDVKIRNEDFSRTLMKKDAIVYKMHGDKNSPDEAVIIKDDYETYQDKREFFSTALRGELLSKTFLFIGFSFDDPNLDYILSRIKILLKDNTPEHFSFFKQVSKSDFGDPNNNQEDFENYVYAKTKQELKIEDLKRYGIHAVMIDDYGEITEILKEIERRIKRKNVFISGAAHTYEPYTQNEAIQLIHELSCQIARSGCRIISGFGLGVGSHVINGVLDFKSKSNQNLEDLLLLRPFPQSTSNNRDDIQMKWGSYRRDMLSEAGIAVFLFGNKLIDDTVINSDGLEKEFEICIENNVIPVPVGATGHMSKKLWDKVMSKPKEFYGNDSDIPELIKDLNDHSKLNKELIEIILKIIEKLNK